MYKTIRLISISQSLPTALPDIIRKFLDTRPEMESYRGNVSTDIIIDPDAEDAPFEFAAIKMTMTKKLFQKEEVFMAIHQCMQPAINVIAEAMGKKFSKQSPVLIKEGEVYIYRLVEPDLEFFDSPIKNKERNPNINLN